MTALPPLKTSVLVIDDDDIFLRVCTTVLKRAGHDVQGVQSARAALDALGQRHFDAVVSDVRMPGTDGIDLLKAVRQRSPRLPFVLMSGEPTVDSALTAIEHRAMRYLRKPFDVDALAQVVAEAVAAPPAEPGPTAAEHDRLTRALAATFMAYQPIVKLSSQAVWAHEALLRCEAPDCASPLELLDLAERTERIHELGRLVRRKVAADVARAPSNTSLFVNLHPSELLDSDLYDPDAPLTRVAPRVVLEITERASVAHLAELPGLIARLRRLGFRVALDDLGAGYSGLTLLARLVPEVVKLDAALVRGLETSPAQRVIIASVVDLAKHLHTIVVAEAIETHGEQRALERLGIDWMQGYRFGRPQKAFAQVSF